MFVNLSRSYSPRAGVMVVDRIDPRLFTDTFYSDCMGCNFCHDLCCQYGATTEITRRDALLARKEELEPVVGRPASEWFDDEFVADPDYEGGGWVRTRVYDGRCVFLNRNGRGCLLHAHALTQSLDVRANKPFACNLFPIGWGEGAFTVPPEIDEGELICLGAGPTLYRSARNDVLYYYGPELIEELDRLETAERRRVRPTMLPLVAS